MTKHAGYLLLWMVLAGPVAAAPDGARAVPAGPWVGAGPLNLNTASATELQQRLHGLGEARAEAIVLYRRQHGRFERMEDLLQVSGFTPLTVARLRPLVTVD